MSKDVTCADDKRIRTALHKHIKCRGDEPHPRGDGSRWHTKLCDALAAEMLDLMRSLP